MKVFKPKTQRSCKTLFLFVGYSTILDTLESLEESPVVINSMYHEKVVLSLQSRGSS